MKDIPAFPLNTPKWHESVSDAGLGNIDFTMGMTLRDYFAAKAMQGMFASSLVPANVTNEELAMEAYKMADAMMKAREV